MSWSARRPRSPFVVCRCRAVLPFLPARIEAPLFQGDAGRASRTLGKFLRDIHINDKAKVIHSFRHRAQDRLRAVGCPEDKRWAILGHEEETIAAGYGEAFRFPCLKTGLTKLAFEKIRRIGSTVPKEVRATVHYRPVVGVSIAFGQRRAFGSKFRGASRVVARAAFSMRRSRAVERTCCEPSVNRADFRPVNFPVVISRP